MDKLFFRQFAALFWKNWIAISKHKLSNLACCVILPVGFGVFLAGAQNFFQPHNKYGLGSPVPIYNFTTQFDGSLALVWADGTNGTGFPSANDIMEHITGGFNEHQLSAVKQVLTPTDIAPHCPENFVRLSGCFAGISFDYLPVSPSDNTPFNYTIRADGGLGYTNVFNHMSDFETRILPLQLAIDEAFITLRTGESIPTPLEWPYAQETNQQQSTYERSSYIRGIRNVTVIAFFLCYIGIAYHLPGATTAERASLLTSHMKAMGLLDSARIISWHVSLSLAYLPAWIAIALIWRHQLFTEASCSLVLAVHVLLGLSLGSWSFFAAAPFGHSPQLAASVSMLLAVLLAIFAIVFSHASTTAATLFTLLFPPGYYVFAIRAICGYENHLMPTNLLKPDPDRNLTLLPIMLACIVNIFMWPYLGALLERYLYDSREPLEGFWSCFNRAKRVQLPPPPSGVAISIKNLNKTFMPVVFSREKGPVTAVSDLSLDIPKSGIFVLLGSNGAGKSTVLSIVANVMSSSSGSITFEGGESRPPRGALGIVPQKNVLFPDLTCYQTLRIWHAIKYGSDSAREDDDYAQLLRDCDLGKKIHSNANTLSGGQKRKLQLAIGLVGGSKIILVDECTSGVDPLSRRALWRTLASVKHDRTIIYTTHFLDEADLLADRIAILTAPGKLVVEGSPVALKTNLGQGYSIQVTFCSTNTNLMDPANSSMEVLGRVLEFAPQCTISLSSPTQVIYHLKSKDSVVVQNVLQLLDDEAGKYHITSVDILGTSIEEIFLDLMESEVGNSNTSEKLGQKSTSTVNVSDPLPSPLKLTDGRPRPPLKQALTIFYKRSLIARKSWLAPLLCILVGVCGSCMPLVFLTAKDQTNVQLHNNTVVPLYWPDSPIPILDFNTTAVSILESPPNITATLGQSAESILTESIPDNATFVSTIQQNYLNVPVGGISVDMETGDSLIAWDATPLPGFTGPTLLNLVTNILYNRAMNASGNAADTPSIIAATYASFPTNAESSFKGLEFALFFGAAMVVYPAFFSLYVSRERRSSVQAMQFSNGLSDPIGLWVGHLLWDSIFAFIVATITVIIFATACKQFHGLGFLWFILVQYGIVGALFSYCVSLFMPCPVTSFAAVAGIQIAVYGLYLAGYLLTVTYAKTSQTSHIITIIHFTLSILSPIASVLRSAFISINMFSLLDIGPTPASVSLMGGILRYGGPILYLFVHGFILFGILVSVDTRSITLPGFLRARKLGARPDGNPGTSPKEDVASETKAVASSSDALRVLDISKSYDGNMVVDRVSFGVPENVIFALLGPNGAGKTTTFKVIRGDVAPDAGDVKIKGISTVDDSRNARLALGVCPQFTAIDTQLTVREHLMIYGRLKGLVPGPELDTDIHSLMVSTSLDTYADRLASQLSCGNQRKLSLAIALIGNPSVVLVDEFSTGIDVRMKRHMWNTLRHVAAGKAVVITTHSMEEASALASKVGILSRKMLAIGTTHELVSRYATYQVHFSCRTREDVLRAQVLMSRIPGARLAEDVATRFEVPIRQGSGDEKDMSLASLFHILSTQGDFGEYTVEKATLENVFLNVIRENNVLEQDDGPRRSRFRFW